MAYALIEHNVFLESTYSIDAELLLELDLSIYLETINQSEVILEKEVSEIEDLE